VQELVCRSNYQTPYGHMDLDVDDGEISFWTGNICDGRTDLTKTFDDIVLLNVLMMDETYQAIMQVVFADANPRAALDGAESGPPAPPAAPSLQPPAQRSSCPRCGRPLQFIPMDRKYFCYHCRIYA